MYNEEDRVASQAKRTASPRFPCSFSLPYPFWFLTVVCSIALTRGTEARSASQLACVCASRYTSGKHSKRVRDKILTKGTRCSTPQKLTYRVPRSNWPLPVWLPACLASLGPPCPRLRRQPRENCATETDFSIASWSPRGVGSSPALTTQGIIPPLFSADRALSRRIRSRKRDWNSPLPRRHYAVLVGPFTARTPCTCALPRAKWGSTIANKFRVAMENRAVHLDASIFRVKLFKKIFSWYSFS